MRKLLIVGGTGGLGSQLREILSKQYDVTSIGSKTLDVRSKNDCEYFFQNNLSFPLSFRFDMVIDCIISIVSDRVSTIIQ